MDYERVNWVEGTTTPLDPTNLNKMDKGIFDNAAAIANLKFVQVQMGFEQRLNNTTNLTSFQNTGLFVSITPKYADSTIHIFVFADMFGPGEYELYNITDAARISGAGALMFETNTSSSFSNQGSVAWHGFYTVNSLAAREFRVRYRSKDGEYIQFCWINPGTILAVEVRAA